MIETFKIYKRIELQRHLFTVLKTNCTQRHLLVLIVDKSEEFCQIDKLYLGHNSSKINIIY